MFKNCLSSVFFVFLLFTGCATLTTGTSQKLTVDTGDVKGATCVGKDKKGRRYVWEKTPSSITVHKGDGPIIVTCKKDGYESDTVTIDEVVVDMTFGNILVGGGIGAMVDGASGAAQRYPDQVTVPMKGYQEVSAHTSTSATSDLPRKPTLKHQLEELKQQAEKGIITPEEYSAKKKKLLDNM